MPYEFEWSVDDDYSGNRYGHREKSDGTLTEGQYAVLLPDGRTQTVKFTSTPKRGYIAEVQYQGDRKGSSTGSKGYGFS